MTQNNTQDLRERAEELLLETDMGSLYRNNQWLYESKDAVNAMLQFASEVSAEKDKRINELEIHMNALKQNAKARIAELEAEIETLKNSETLHNEYMKGFGAGYDEGLYDGLNK